MSLEESPDLNMRENDKSMDDEQDSQSQFELSMNSAFDPSMFDFNSWTTANAETALEETTNSSHPVEAIGKSLEMLIKGRTSDQRLGSPTDTSFAEEGGDIAKQSMSTINISDAPQSSDSRDSSFLVRFQSQKPLLDTISESTDTLVPVSDASSVAASALAYNFLASQQAGSQQQLQQNSAAIFDSKLYPSAFNTMASINRVSAFFQQQNQLPNTEAKISIGGTTAVPQCQPPSYVGPALANNAVANHGSSHHHHHHNHHHHRHNKKMPPFHLFDAPVELRANFMAAQRALGEPTLQDNNSVHYDMAGVVPFDLSGVMGFDGQPIRLIDGRHGNLRNKRVKNEREQKRTQKIADLIELLRLKMEKGGWKVGLKSKFHTLSSCAEYVKHLEQVNKEKEGALDKAKQDLRERQCKMEEDKRARHEGPSDPESITSSLTASSSSEDRMEGNGMSQTPDKVGKGKKRKCDDVYAGEEKARLRPHEMSSPDNTKQPPTHNKMNVEQLVSISDITDSNKDSSSDGNSSSRSQQERTTNYKNSHCELPRNKPAEATLESHKQVENHSKSKIILEGRNRNTLKTRSRQISKSLRFDLDYEEVFINSNVPQIIATTAGRIVAWNDFFLNATGLAATEVDRLTIFSFVQSNRLSDLFEVVATALRYGTMDSQSTEGCTADKAASQSDEIEKNKEAKWGEFTSVTLPCKAFARHPKVVHYGDQEFSVQQLYMTLTLMTDVDPKKRCFHCVFTDCLGSSGAMGRVTPQFLSLMFR